MTRLGNHRAWAPVEVCPDENILDYGIGLGGQGICRLVLVTHCLSVKCESADGSIYARDMTSGEN